jgi:hypothetical protein
MHQDGSIVSKCSERWPTREQAQAVLDKYQPKHEWKHGDVFRLNGLTAYTMMYIDTCTPDDPPSVVYVNDNTRACGPTAEYLAGAMFLFNIKDRLNG